MEPISETNDTLISPQTPTPTERRPFNVTADVAAAWTTERLEQQLADYEERIAVMGDKINDHLDEGGRIEDSWYIRTRDARNHLRRQVRTIKVELRNRGRSRVAGTAFIAAVWQAIQDRIGCVDADAVYVDVASKHPEWDLSPFAPRVLGGQG